MGGMTQDLFRQNAYLTECTATVTAITPLGLELDRTVFYPLGGGQAGDTGVLVLADGSQIAIIDTRKGKSADGSFNGQIAHQPTPDVLEQLLFLRSPAAQPVILGSEPNGWTGRAHSLMPAVSHWDPTPNSLHLRFSATLASRGSSTTTVLEACSAHSTGAGG